jgi:hypothetical protein
MLAAEFRRIVTTDTVDLLGTFLGFLEEKGIDYCVIGGQAVNAYVEPLVSLDLDVAVAVQDIEGLARLLSVAFTVSVHPHSLNVSLQGSSLRVRLQTDQRYSAFVRNAEVKEVLGRPMRVAQVGDVLQGKLWAASDPERRGSKRQKDLADIARILDSYPNLRGRVPGTILAKLE